MTGILNWLGANWRWVTATLGVVAGFVAAGGYLIAIVRKEVPISAKPHRFTWFVWTVGAIGGAYFTYKGHAGASGITVATAMAILITATWLLSLKKEYGHKGLERWYHPWVAVLGLLVYALQIAFGFPPLWAVLAAVAVDATASWVQVQKVRGDPWSEPPLPWAIGTFGAALGLASLVNWNFTSAAFPVYYVASNLVILGVLVLQQQRIPQPKG